MSRKNNLSPATSLHNDGREFRPPATFHLATQVTINPDRPLSNMSFDALKVKQMSLKCVFSFCIPPPS